MSLLAPVVDVGGGRAKRKPGQRFPRPFYAYDSRENKVLGAFLLDECACLADASELYWRVARWVPFAHVENLAAGDIAWRSTLSHLAPAVDQRFRSNDAAVGGTIRGHFLGFEGARWDLWPLTPAQRHGLEHTPPPYTFLSESKFAKAVGVEPQVVRLNRDMGQWLLQNQYYYGT